MSLDHAQKLLHTDSLIDRRRHGLGPHTIDISGDTVVAPELCIGGSQRGDGQGFPAGDHLGRGGERRHHLVCGRAVGSGIRRGLLDGVGRRRRELGVQQAIYPREHDLLGQADGQPDVRLKDTAVRDHVDLDAAADRADVHRRRHDAFARPGPHDLVNHLPDILALQMPPHIVLPLGLNRLHHIDQPPNQPRRDPHRPLAAMGICAVDAEGSDGERDAQGALLAEADALQAAGLGIEHDVAQPPRRRPLLVVIAAAAAALLEEKAAAELPARLLVADDRQRHATVFPRQTRPVLVQVREGNHRRGRAGLHVHAAAPVDVRPVKVARPWPAVPPLRVLRRIYGEHVQVSVEDDALAGRRRRRRRRRVFSLSLSACRRRPRSKFRHEVRLLRPVRRYHLRLNPLSPQILPQHLCRRGGVAGRVRRRCLDESLEERDVRRGGGGQLVEELCCVHCWG